MDAMWWFVDVFYALSDIREPAEETNSIEYIKRYMPRYLHDILLLYCCVRKGFA